MAEVEDKAVAARDFNVEFTGLDAVDLFLRVDPKTAKVTASYSTLKDGVSSAIKPLPAIPVTAEMTAKMKAWFTQADRGVAAGILSTSNSGDVHVAPTSFSAAWDLFTVTPGEPTTEEPEGPGTGGTPSPGTGGTPTPGTGGTPTPGTGGTPKPGTGTPTTTPGPGTTGTTPGTPAATPGTGTTTNPGTGTTGGGTPATQVTPRDRTRPVLDSVRLTRSAFRTRGTARRGTTVRLALSEAADVRLTVQRAVAGRSVGGSCARPTRANRRAAACVRWVTVPGAVERELVAGRAELPFAGRLAGRALAAGSYRMTLTATDAAGNRSATTRVAFRVTG
jgi:hypothetical protein